MKGNTLQHGGGVVQLQRCSDLCIISDTAKGRGVFATADISARTVLDVCPVLILDPAENERHVQYTTIHHYSYNWPMPDRTTGKMNTTQAIVFGLGSMFNHSTLSQNVGWERDLDNQVIRYTALRDIGRGEELCISYGTRLTFRDADAPSTDGVEHGQECADAMNGLGAIACDRLLD